MTDTAGVPSRMDPPATLHDTEVDTCDLSQSPSSAAARTVLATQEGPPSQILTPLTTPKRRARRDRDAAYSPGERQQARLLFPKEPSHPQPDIIPVHRATGQPVNLRANFVAYLGWRWSIRAQPPLNGVARLSPKVALEDWLAKHKGNISPESVRVVQARLDNWEQAPGPVPRPPQPARGKGKGKPGKGPGRGVPTQGGSPNQDRQQEEGTATPPLSPRSDTQPLLDPPLPWVMSVDEGQQATQEDVDSQTGQSLQETWPCAPELFALTRANIGTERHLPRSCKAACKTLFRSLMDQVQDDPTGTVSGHSLAPCQTHCLGQTRRRDSADSC